MAETKELSLLEQEARDLDAVIRLLGVEPSEVRSDTGNFMMSRLHSKIADSSAGVIVSLLTKSFVWSRAPHRTFWSPDMVALDLPIGKDETMRIFAHRNTVDKTK